MLSCVVLTGEIGPALNPTTRIINVSRPIMDNKTRSYLVDSFVVRVENPPGTSLQIMKVPEGTLVMIKGRIQSDLAANKFLEENGFAPTCFVIVAEITECYTLSEGMAGYQEFFPITEKD